MRMNKINIHYCLIAFIFFLALPVYAVKIQVVYPKEGDTISAASRDSTFIFGNVTPAKTALSINGHPVRVYSNGAFLAWLPIEPGNFAFNCVAVSKTDTAQAQRNVYIPLPLQTPSTDNLQIVAGSERPNVVYRLLPGDLLRVSFRGTPGCSAVCFVEGIQTPIPMAENAPAPEYYLSEFIFGDIKPPVTGNICGLYTGSYVLQPGDSCRNARIIMQLGRNSGEIVTSTATGTVDLIDPQIPEMVELLPEETVLRTARNTGYYYFLPRATKLWITGQKGDFLRARLSPAEEAWVQITSTRQLPSGTIPPQIIVNVVRTRSFAGFTRVTVNTREKLPFRVEQNIANRTMTVRFYGVISDTDWMRFDCDDPLIREIRWNQESPEVYMLTIHLQQKQQWGYQTRFNEQGHFELDIKKSPAKTGWFSSPLKNTFIVLDPGHTPDKGAVGPTGAMEKDVNLILARELGEKLRKKGAFVFYTHEEDGISLAGRKRLAEILNPDFLLSLHHNAIPDGINPFSSRGTSVYYFHPQSCDLARLVQNKLLQEFKLPNFGLFYDNLAMCRPTQMPAILIEPAFMMHPEEEMLILSKKYPGRCANAIIDALEEYLEKNRD